MPLLSQSMQDRAKRGRAADHALEHALIIAPEARDPTLLARLDAVAGRVLKG